jgi:hypothetical protein
VGLVYHLWAVTASPELDVAVNVVCCPAQTGVPEFIMGEIHLSAVITFETLDVHPFEPETVTEYVVLDVGLTEIRAVLSPVFHK